MEFKPGSRWKSVVCNTEVVVVRPPKVAVSLECGGHPMTAAGSEVQPALSLSADHSTGTHVGKRYYDEESGIELLGSKAGTGSLSVNGRPLKLKQAKPLPASD
jgi:hypothetical protein